MKTKLIGIMFKGSNKIYDFLNIDDAVIGDEVYYFSKNGKKLRGTVVRNSIQSRNSLSVSLSNYLPAYLA